MWWWPRAETMKPGHLGSSPSASRHWTTGFRVLTQKNACGDRMRWSVWSLPGLVSSKCWILLVLVITHQSRDPEQVTSILQNPASLRVKWGPHHIIQINSCEWKLRVTHKQELALNKELQVERLQERAGTKRLCPLSALAYPQGLEQCQAQHGHPMVWT